MKESDENPNKVTEPTKVSDDRLSNRQLLPNRRCALLSCAVRASQWWLTQHPRGALRRARRGAVALAACGRSGGATAVGFASPVAGAVIGCDAA